MTAIAMESHTFGRLVVIERAGTTARGDALWRCECSCGGDVTVRGYALRSGNTRSCGCKQRDWTASGKARMIDIAGQRFGRLTAVDRADSRRWVCRCDCGGSTVVRTSKLMNGRTRSCGCLLNRKPYTSYDTLHKRLAKILGPASARKCVTCGSPAAHWSYDHHGGPREMVDPDRGLAYSLDVEDYSARCVQCHKALDNHHK